MTELVNIPAEDWNRARRQVSQLRTGMIFLLLLVVALVIAFFMLRPGQTNVLRTHGLVIVDAQGHDRILIGAPVPASKDRIRKDDASDGIIFLGNTGADRLAVGQTPTLHINGRTYKRRGGNDNYGLTLYDTKGNERGGMGFLGMGRAVIALDRAAPLSDAIGLMVDDKDGFAGMSVNYADRNVQAPAFELGATANEVHMQFYGKDNLPHAQLNFDGKGKPAWQFDDAASAAKAAPAPTN